MATPLQMRRLLRHRQKERSSWQSAQLQLHAGYLSAQHQQRCRLILVCVILPILPDRCVSGQRSDGVCGGVFTSERVVPLPVVDP